MLWHPIHDFFHGWGLCEHIDNNTVTIEDHPDGPIPWKTVRTVVQPRIIWASDCRRLLHTGLPEAEDVLTVYEQLQALLAAEKRQRQPIAVNFTRITAPRLRGDIEYPDIRSVFS